MILGLVLFRSWMDRFFFFFYFLDFFFFFVFYFTSVLYFCFWHQNSFPKNNTVCFACSFTDTTNFLHVLINY